MVTGSTANEIGDFIIGKLVDPYENVIRVTDWSILAGLSNDYTVGKISFTEGSTTVSGYGTNFNLSPGDSIIVGNHILEVGLQVTPLHIELADPAPFTTSMATFMILPDANNEFIYEYRWSHTNEEFSEFKLLTKDMNPGDLMFINWDGTRPLWIDVKGTVDRLTLGASLTMISITFTLETTDGEIVACPQYCLGCDDPYSYIGCANIKPCTTDENIFKPYELNKSDNLYRQLVEISTDIFGWPVRYYRTEPDERTKDVIFMEYSLFNVVAQGDVKVSVPDNEMPTQQINYDIFGMGFEDFEIHIADYQFEKTFGPFKRPRVKDYLYFPKLNRMYEVKSVSLADEFNVNHTYWKVMLAKYQDRSSVIKSPTAEAELQDLVVGMDDIFGAEIQDENKKVTKPQQLQGVSHIWEDGVRTGANALVKINDYDLKNRWTIVSKHHYDLSVVPMDQSAVEYIQPAKQTQDENLAFTFWVQPTFDNLDPTKYTLIQGEQFGVGLTARLSSSKLELMINNQPYTFMHGLILGTDEWYAVVINLSNDFREIGVYVYHLNEQLNYVRPQDGNNNLELEFKEIRPTTQSFIWDIDRGYQLRGGKLKMTNIRIWKKTIEEEQHSNVLNQSLVRDAQYALVIDNAIPSLSYQRYRNAR
jgi:hypothetical protein